MRAESAAVMKALEAVYAVLVDINKNVASFCDAPLINSPKGRIEVIADVAAMCGAHGIATYCEQLLQSVSLIEEIGARGAPRSLIQERVKSFQVFTFALGKYIEETAAGKSPPIKPLRQEFEKMYRENNPEALAACGVDGLAKIMRCPVVVGAEVGVDGSFDRALPLQDFVAELAAFESGGKFRLHGAPIMGLGAVVDLLAFASSQQGERVLFHARGVAKRLREAIETRSAFLVDWVQLSSLVAEIAAAEQTEESQALTRRFEIGAAGVGDGANHESMRKLLEKMRELQSVFNKALTQRAPRIIAGPAKMVSDYVSNLGVPALTLHSAEFLKLCDSMVAGGDTWENWVAAAKRLILMEESVVGWGSPATQDALLRSIVEPGVVNDFMIDRAARQALKALKAGVLKDTAAMRGGIDSTMSMMAQGKSEEELLNVLNATKKEIERSIPVLQAFFWAVGCHRLECAVTQLEEETLTGDRFTFLMLRSASDKLSVFDAAINSIVFGNQAHVDAEYGAILCGEQELGAGAENATAAQDPDVQLGQPAVTSTPVVSEDGGLDATDPTQGADASGSEMTEQGASLVDSGAPDGLDELHQDGGGIVAAARDELGPATEPKLDFSLEGDTTQVAAGEGAHAYSAFVTDAERAGATNVIDSDGVDSVLAGIMVDESEDCMFAINSLLAADTINVEGWHTIKRHVHTMKGVLRTCGLMDCGSALHRLEDQLDLFDEREGIDFMEASRAGMRELLDFVDASLDAARVVAGRIAAPRVPSPAAGQVEEALGGQPLAAPNLAEAEAAPEPAPEAEKASDVALARDVKASVDQVGDARAASTPVPQPSVEGQPVTQALIRVPASALQSVVVGVGDTERLAQAQRGSLDVVAAKLADVSALLARMVTYSKSLATLAAADAAAKGLQHGGLDQFGPLQATSAGITEAVRDLGLYAEELGEQVARLRSDGRSSVQRMERMSTKVSELLLVEMSTQRRRIEMTCERACRELGKAAEVVIERGAQLPTAVVDRIGPAIEHVIRNAVAHGIEPPADRVAAGKRPQGRIVLRGGAAQNGMIALEIEDDGAGINRDKVIARAMERGIIQRGEGLSDQDVFQLLMVPGFSTADKVTSVAGRGVGLDAVRDAVVSLGGSLTIRSTPGHGTVFVLVLPSGESMMSAVPVWALDQMCLIPSAFVVRVMPIEDLVDDGFGRVRLPEGSAKIIRLSELLPVVSRPGVAYGEDVVITRDPTGLKAVVVSKVGHKMRVSPQALPSASRAVPGLMGVARTSPTEMAFIVNPGLMKPAVKGAPVLDSRPVALVADDSPTIRAVNARALEALGFRVVLAKDGLAARGALRSDPTIAVLVTDIEMPGLNGLELIKEIRAGECGRQNLPAVIVSSRTGVQQQTAARALGVEIIGKPADPAAVAKKAQMISRCATV